MSELPEGWASTSLETLTLDQRNGLSPKPNADAGVQVLRISSVRPMEVDLSADRFYDPAPKGWERYCLEEGDLLFTRYSGTPAFVGVCGVVPKPNRQIVYPDKLIRVRLDRRVALPHFIEKSMATGLSRKTIQENLKTTSGQVGISGASIKVTPVPLPPLNEQKRIVAKIDALTEKSREAKQALDEVPALLDQLRQSILAAAFRGDLTKKWREQNPNVEPASVLLDRIRQERRRKWEETELAKFKAKGKLTSDNKWKAKYKEPEPVDTEGLPELPEGWCWASVGGLCTAVADGVHKKPNYVDSGVPFVTVRNMTAGPGISFENLNYITQEDHEEYIKRTHPEKGDVLISKDGTLGVVRLIETDRVFSIFVSVAVMKPAIGGFGRHLSTMLETPQVQELFVHTGTGLKHIHLADLRATPIPLPPASEQEEIQRQIRRFLGVVENQEKVLERWEDSLATLDSTILAKAFRGELVPQDPNDEPASVLLERIRKERETATPKKKSREGIKS